MKHSPVTSGYAKHTRTLVVMWHVTQIAAPSHPPTMPALIIIEVLYTVFVIFKSASLLFQIAGDRVGDCTLLSALPLSRTLVIIKYANYAKRYGVFVLMFSYGLLPQLYSSGLLSNIQPTP